MAALQRVRHKLSVFIPRCVFLLLYLGGALLLLLGLIFSAQAWWRLILQHGSLWAICITTIEIFVLTAAFSSILIIPWLDRRDFDQTTSQQAERRSWSKRSLQLSK